MRIKFKRSGNNFTSLGRTLNEELEAALCTAFDDLHN
jgi:hypothetical protein